MSTKSTGRDQFRAESTHGIILQAREGSPRRLGIDCIDLYTMHHPDPDTPIDETLGALEELIQQGKVRAIGVSNFAGWQVAEADHTANTS